jgi:hypothetical protein
MRFADPKIHRETRIGIWDRRMSDEDPFPTVSGISPKARPALPALRSDSKGGTLDVDHIVQGSKGDTNTLDNLQTPCFR